MRGTGLEFAPGTTDACRLVVGRLFQPADILGAYRAARSAFKTGDLVLVASEQNPDGFQALPRMTYLAQLRATLGHHAPKTLSVLGINHKSAHAVVKLPLDSEAVWLIITRGPQDLPIMCVIYGVPQEVTSGASALN